VRILYYHQHFSTRAGSTGTRSYEMARRLVASGHEVMVVCGSYGAADTGLTGPFARDVRRGSVDGIEVVELRLPYSNKDGFARRATTFLRFAARSVWLALTERYDLVFATSTPLTAGLPGIAGRWLRGKPFIFEVRDLWPELPREMGVIRNSLVLRLLDALEWLCYRSAQRLVALSPGIVSGIGRRGIPEHRIALIPNGCDLDIFAGAAHAWRPDGVAATDLLAVFAGTHGMANGLDAVLDAAGELLRRARTDVKLVLVGDGHLKAKLMMRAERESLTNVLFHSPVSKGDLAGLLHEADIGLQILANVPAFYYGTSPNKFFDYIAAGLPVLTNYPGWLADLITREQCGFAVRPEDPAAFADALEYAASHRAELKEMGRRARKLAMSEFDREDLGRKFVTWLEQPI
jgi:glycosyltransferase involved in cell wall biosynthesis